MKQGITRFSFLLFIACLLLPASAQDQAVASDSTAAPIQPYALADISEQSNNTITSANKLGGDRLKEDEMEDYRSDVDSFLIPIDTFLLDTIFNHLDKFTSWDLDKANSRINMYISQVSAKEANLRRHYKILENDYSELSTLRKRWMITRDAEVAEELQETFVGRIDMALSAIDSVNAILKSDMDALLLLTDRLLDRSNKLSGLKDKVINASLALSQSMFSRDNRPLVKELDDLKQGGLLSGHFSMVRKSVESDVEIFKSEFKEVIRTSIILFILLFSFLTWFSYNYKSLISQNKLNLKEWQRKLILSPLLTSVFSTFIIIHFVFKELPFTFSVINLLILSTPIAILAIHFLGKQVTFWVIWTIISYMLSLVYQLIFAPDVLQRIFLLILSLTGLVMSIWLLLDRNEHHLFKSEAGRKLQRISSGIFMVMLFSAILANFLGAFGLATFITLLPFQISFLLLAVIVLARYVDIVVYMFLGSNLMLKVNAVDDFFIPIYKWITRFVEFFFILFFISNALRILRVRAVVLDWGENLLTSPLTIGKAEISLMNIVIFVFIIWLSVFITKIVRYVLEKDVFPRVKTAKGVPGTIIMMVRIILITGGFFLAATAAGMALTNLSIILGAFSVGIGFGLQNIFNNMVSGLILAFERPINVGDVVQVGTLMGTMKHLGLRASKVKSFDGAEVIVPNGNLISDQLINWTLSDAYRRMDIRVGVAYGTDPKLVLQIMKETANEHKMVRKEPPPSTFFIGFGDSSLDFRLLAWVDVDNRLTVESELHVTINEKIIEAGIEIPFPQRDLHIRSDDTKAIEEAKPKPKPKPDAESKSKSEEAPEEKAKGEDLQDIDGALNGPAE